MAQRETRMLDKIQEFFGLERTTQMMMAIDLWRPAASTRRCALVRALGAHRYVAGRLHLAHAFAVAAVADDAAGVLAEARAWALRDARARRAASTSASRDERLWRRCSDAELAAVLDAYWTPGDAVAGGPRRAPRRCLDRHGLAVRRARGLRRVGRGRDPPAARSTPAGSSWRSRELDPERHRGAIAAVRRRPRVRVGALRGGDRHPSAAAPLRAPGPRARPSCSRVRGDDGTLAAPLVVWVARRRDVPRLRRPRRPPRRQAPEWDAQSTSARQRRLVPTASRRRRARGWR